jgi:hypothetical protein
VAPEIWIYPTQEDAVPCSISLLSPETMETFITDKAVTKHIVLTTETIVSHRNYLPS